MPKLQKFREEIIDQRGSPELENIFKRSLVEVRKNPDLWIPWNYLVTLENIQKSDVLLKFA